MSVRAKLTTALVLGALLFTLTGCKKLKARDELNKGVRAYKGADIQQAIDHFQRAVEYDPELLTAQVYLATAYASLFVPGSPEEENKERARRAIAEFEKVLEADPGNTHALGYIAQMYFNLEEFDRAKEYRRKLIEVDPSNPEHYYAIGVIDWTLTYKPRMSLKRELGLRDDEPLPRRRIPELAEKNSELVEEGIDVLQKALQLNPKYGEAMAYLNLMYREKADIVESPQEREALLQRADELAERAGDLMKQAREASSS